MKVSKTKLAGFGFIVYGIAGFFTGHIDANTAIQQVLTGIAIIGGRSALDKIGK